MTIYLSLFRLVRALYPIRLHFERLPSQVSKYFADASLLIIYPDQLGDPQEIVSFSDPRGQSETRMYDNVGKWFYKWFKKGDERN
mgnify:CR=1 FL=1